MIEDLGFTVEPHRLISARALVAVVTGTVRAVNEHLRLRRKPS